VELAAAGVSIALFNQASKITIFPLVSITTSFVAEEDTIKRMNIKAAENDKSKLTEVTPESDVVQDIEKGTPKESNKAQKESVVGHNETNGTLGNNDKTNGVGILSLSTISFRLYNISIFRFSHSKIFLRLLILQNFTSPILKF